MYCMCKKIQIFASHYYYLCTYVCMFSGAVYQAATLSKAFVVKKFLIKEATVYPIEVIIHTYLCTCSTVQPNTLLLSGACP